jgi:hypothetical protein
MTNTYSNIPNMRKLTNYLIGRFYKLMNIHVFGTYNTRFSQYTIKEALWRCCKHKSHTYSFESLFNFFVILKKLKKLIQKLQQQKQNKANKYKCPFLLIVGPSWSWSYVQSVPIPTKTVSLNPTRGEVCSIQHYVIKFFSDLPQLSSFPLVLQFPLPIKLTTTM